MQTAGKFDRNTNRGTKRCRLCKVLKQEANIDHSTGLCQRPTDGQPSCFDMAGQENSHSDNEGSEWCHTKTPQADCSTCHPELEALYTPEGRAAVKERA